MGVKGLKSFVKQNPCLLTDYELKDCELVIDGSNLFHFIYHDFENGINQLYGGDYDTFSDRIKLFFDKLKDCNVSPFVVLDGGDEPDDRKFETIQNRLKERIGRVVNISHGHVIRNPKSSQVTPILARQTFIHTLNSLGISHVTCDGEADYEIAALANEKNCPVLSNDSDFFIFSLSSGFLLLDELHFTQKRYANGKIFNQKAMLKSIKCQDPKILPLFATLQGNDFVDPNFFKPFFKVLQNIKTFPGYKGMQFEEKDHEPFKPSYIKYNKQNRPQTPEIKIKISSLIKWLAERNFSDVAIHDVLNNFEGAKRDNIKQIILTSIKSYVNLTSSLLSDVMTRSNLMLSYTGKDLPAWFLKRLRKGKISPKLLNAVRLHKVINKCQIENTQEPNSYNCSLRIREIIYGVLFSLEDLPVPSSITTTDCKPREKIIVEYERDGYTTKASNVVPNCVFGRGCIRFENFAAIEERRRFILKCINDNEIETQQELEKIGEDSDILLPLLAVIYWARNAQKISALHVVVIVASIFQLSGFLFVESENAEGHVSNENKSNSKRLYHTPRHSKTNQFDCERVHAFAQYQTCFQALLQLNNLLLCPFKDISPSLVFNGTLTYNLYEELRFCDDPLSSIHDLLCRISNIDKNSFEQMYSFVRNQIPQKYHHLKRHGVEETVDQA